MVKHREKIKIANEIKISLLFKIIEKKARSSLNFNPFNLEMLPVSPINKTIKKIIKNEISKLFTKIFSFLAAYIVLATILTNQVPKEAVCHQFDL